MAMAEVDDADEADEMPVSDEADEVPLGLFSPGWSPNVASGQRFIRLRPATQYVTQAQLQTALARVGAQVRTNSNAIKQVGARVVAATAAIKKETSERKKDLEKVRNALNQTQQMAAILPLLTQPKSITTTADIPGGIPRGTQVLVDGSNTINLFLPLLLLTSIGDGSGTGGGGLLGGGGAGGDNTMMMLLIILAATGGLGK